MQATEEKKVESPPKRDNSYKTICHEQLVRELKVAIWKWDRAGRPHKR